jgi:hypothetical protein
VDSIEHDRFFRRPDGGQPARSQVQRAERWRTIVGNRHDAPGDRIWFVGHRHHDVVGQTWIGQCDAR